MEEIIKNPLITEITKWIIIVLLTVIMNGIRKVNNRITYLDYKLIATDHALEKSFDNGYANYRDAKLKELMQKNNFINKIKQGV